MGWQTPLRERFRSWPKGVKISRRVWTLLVVLNGMSALEGRWDVNLSSGLKVLNAGARVEPREIRALDTPVWKGSAWWILNMPTTVMQAT